MSKVVEGIFECKNLKFTEQKGLGSSGSAILGFVEGSHFVPGGHSRNGGRFYSNGLWEKQIGKNEDVKRMLNDRSMFGTIGHDSEITEKEIREGLPTHITTEMALEKDGIKGYAKSEILDTPSGNLLATYLRAGTNLYVSSRADGSFLKEKIKGPNGGKVDELDPDTFQLERFDFVVKPGFLEANPKIKEGLSKETMKIYESLEESNIITEQDKNNNKPKDKNKDREKDPDDSDQTDDLLFTDKDKDNDDDTNNNGDENMITKTVDSSKSEVDQLESLLTEIESLKSELSVLKASKQESSETLETYKSYFEKVGEPKEIKETLLSVENFFEQAGNPKQIKLAFENVISFFKESGSPKQIEESFQKVFDFFEEVGPPNEIKENLEITCEFFEEVGSPKEVKESFKVICEFFDEVGNPNQIKAFIEKMGEFFKANGNSKEIQEKLSRLTSLTETYGDEKTLDKALEDSKKLHIENKGRILAEELGVNQELVIKMMKEEKQSEEMIRKYFKSVNDAATDSYTFNTPKVEDKTSKNKIAGIINYENTSPLSRVLTGRGFNKIEESK